MFCMFLRRLTIFSTDNGSKFHSLLTTSSQNDFAALLLAAKAGKADTVHALLAHPAVLVNRVDKVLFDSSLVQIVFINTLVMCVTACVATDFF